MKKKVVPMVRVNTRVRKNQQTFIKKMAKTEDLTEGDVIRFMVDAYINSLK